MKQRLGIIIALTLILSVWMGVAYADPVLLSSISSKLKRPALVALDMQGNIYVSETSDNVVRIYDAQGNEVNLLRLQSPLGLAVDTSGFLYIASGKKSTIEVYNPDLTFARTFATDIRTNSITFDKDGKMYVVDGIRDRIVVFDAAGQVLFTFGSTGGTEGLFNTPTSLAINDDAGEIYVADLQKVSINVNNSNDLTNGARIQVFDKNGVFKRSFGKYGWGDSEIQKPVGIAVEKTGKLVVVDSGQGRAHVLDPLTGASVGVLRDPTTPPNLPTGIAIGGNNLAYLVSYSGARIDIYALDGYVTMALDPLSLTFVGTQYAGNPDPKTIVISNTGDGTLNWSATADQTWINLGKQDPIGPKTAGGLVVGLNISTFGVGTYTGTITINSGFGQKQVVGVTLSVVQPPILNVSNGWLTFTARKGTTASAQGIALSVDNLTGAVNWGIASDSPSWLTVSPASGIISSTTSTAAATVSVNTTGLKAGSYSGLLTVSAPGAIGTGGKITVNLTVTPSTKINVNTNRSEAKFSVTGPATYSGSGAAWSVEDVPAGDYTVTFDAVAGYKKPLPQAKSLAGNGEVTFSGNYASWQELAARKNIVVAKGPGVKNDALVKAYKNNGNPVAFDLVALSTRFGANVAVGDIDGDGVAELIVGAGDGATNPATVRVFKNDKTQVLEFVPFGTLSGVRVAAADLNGDGRAEIIVSPAGSADNTGKVAVYTFDAGQKKMVSTGIEFTAYTYAYGANIVVADIDGTGKPVIVTAPGPGKQNPALVRLWKLDVTPEVGSWTATLQKDLSLGGAYGATIAAGDVDGDGKDEVIIGTSGDNAMVTIVKGDGSRSGFKAFDKNTVNVAAADLDGDGIVEIIAAQGPNVSQTGASDKSAGDGKQGTKKDGKEKEAEYSDADQERGVVRVFSAAGKLHFVIAPFEGAQDGINVAVGDLGL